MSGTTASMPRVVRALSRHGALIALAALVLFGALRYDNFLGVFNILTLLRYNAMFALVSLGMGFVIMTGGIDLSVGAVAALGSVASALLSPYGWLPGLLGGIGAGLLLGSISAFMIVRLRILPFIATLAAMLAAGGCALLLAGNESVSASYDTSFTELGQGDLLGLPVPAWIAVAAHLIGAVALNLTAWDRTVASVYVVSGGLAGLAGVILAAQFGAGQPIEGVGWELFAIASAVVGGTLLTGGVGSVGSTLVGVLLLGLIFNILNFENGLGHISLSAYWQSVIRGLFLLLVVALQARLARQAEAAA
jgi:ribose/xylose/arabinose/galactoside ABC-type transport system permease subunit